MLRLKGTKERAVAGGDVSGGQRTFGSVRHHLLRVGRRPLGCQLIADEEEESTREEEENPLESGARRGRKCTGK